MAVTRHTRVTSEKVKDAALATVDYGDATITEAKFSEHLEHGTIVNVDSVGRYKTFTTAYGGVPNVVVTGRGADAQLVGAPTAGSFKVKTTGGTVTCDFISWGAR